jgi:threonine aldolase
MKTIDLRSDTVTRPTARCARPMAAAEVGDDVYGEDPTVNRLQAVAAERLGMTAALFVPSGTMANQSAIRALTRHGDVVLASPGCHLLRHESGGAAALSGVQILTVGSAGVFTPDEVAAALPPHDHHYAPVTTVALENTHNGAGGRCGRSSSFAPSWTPRANATCACISTARACGTRWSPAASRRAAGSRVSTRSPSASRRALGAPVGSLVCGSSELIARVHRIRKMLGGGMRQAGVLAAAGLHALEHHVERLAEDHRNAQRLADGLRELGLSVSPTPRRTSSSSAAATSADCCRRWRRVGC